MNQEPEPDTKTFWAEAISQERAILTILKNYTQKQRQQAETELDLKLAKDHPETAFTKGRISATAEIQSYIDYLLNRVQDPESKSQGDRR